MDYIPVCRLMISRDGSEPIEYIARPTVYVPSSGYSSGDYETDVLGVTLWYTLAGTYRGTYQNASRVSRHLLDRPSVLDFSDVGGPVLTISSSRMDVINDRPTKGPTDMTPRPQVPAFPNLSTDEPGEVTYIQWSVIGTEVDSHGQVVGHPRTIVRDLDDAQHWVREAARYNSPSHIECRTVVVTAGEWTIQRPLTDAEQDG